VVILLLRDQQFHADPDGIGSQTVQSPDISTAVAVPQFLLCNLPEVITGNNGIDFAGGKGISLPIVFFVLSGIVWAYNKDLS